MERHTYTWVSNKNAQRQYTVNVYLYDTQKEMLDEYRARQKQKIVDSAPDAIFVPAAMNGTYVGSIRLSRELLTRENIIHECFHAGIELCRHMGRKILYRYEEFIVCASAQLASTILKDYEKEIINV